MEFIQYYGGQMIHKLPIITVDHHQRGHFDDSRSFIHSFIH